MDTTKHDKIAHISFSNFFTNKCFLPSKPFPYFKAMFRYFTKQAFLEKSSGFLTHSDLCKQSKAGAL